MKIESLTKEQELALVAYREKWLAIGRSTSPADRSITEAVITEMYKRINEPAPIFWWSDGPAVACIVRCLMKSNLGANLGDNLGDNLWANLRDNLSWHFWGRHEAAWPAFYLFPHEALKEMHTAPQMELLNLWLDLSRHCGWWAPFKGICFCCEPPSVQEIDDQGRLHCETGPAMLCRDSFGVWAHHGVRVRRYIIEEPSKITVREIEAETNAEVRRVMIEKFGQSRYLIEAGAIEVHRDDFGTLYRKDVAGDEALVMVKVVNSTPEPDGSFRDYFLRVPPAIKRAREAVAWTFDKPELEYNPELQT